jgi:hypothetical protein
MSMHEFQVYGRQSASTVGNEAGGEVREEEDAGGGAARRSTVRSGKDGQA